MEKRKRLTRDQKREQAVIDLLNQMFIIAGHSVTYDDIKGRTDNASGARMKASALIICWN